MKNFMGLVLTYACLTNFAFAQKDEKFKLGQINRQEISCKQIQISLNLTTSSLDAYDYQRAITGCHFLPMEYELALSVPAMIGAGLLIGAPAVWPTFLLVNGGSEVADLIVDIKFERAQKLIGASRKCAKENICNYKILTKTAKWINAKLEAGSVELSNKDIARSVAANFSDAKSCLKKIKRNGNYRLIGYKELRNRLLKIIKTK